MFILCVVSRGYNSYLASRPNNVNLVHPPWTTSFNSAHRPRGHPLQLRQQNRDLGEEFPSEETESRRWSDYNTRKVGTYKKWLVNMCSMYNPHSWWLQMEKGRLYAAFKMQQSLTQNQLHYCCYYYFNLFWNYSKYFSPNSTALSWIGTNVLSNNYHFSLHHPTALRPSDKHSANHTEWTRGK